MMRAYRFYLITIGLIFITFTMMTISVNATKDKRLQHMDEYYEQIEDEYVEVTPTDIRMRKAILDPKMRFRNNR